MNQENLEQAERQLIRCSELEDEFTQVRNVKVGEHAGQDVYLHTVVCGDTNNPNKMAFVHGYGACSALFYKTYKYLAQHFCVHFIDIIGMASSSRPLDYNISKITPEESIAYFVDYIENWRKANDDLKDFVLVGHSFGGYLVGNYALKYP